MNIEDLKLGIYEKALSQNMDWPQRLAAAARTGFQFVEMSVDETDSRLSRLDWDRSARKKFVMAVLDSGISVPSMCLSAHRRFPLGSHNPEIRSTARRIMEQAILFAVDTGIRTIQLAGYDVYYEESDKDTLKWFFDGLISAVELASRENVMLAMEIMDTPLMRSVVRYLNYYNRIKSPWFMVYPDLGNLSAWGNDVPEELRIGSSHIVAIHLKDTLAVTPDFPGKFKEVPFGDGCVDFVTAFETLKELNYSGPFLIEMWTEKSGNPEKEIVEARKWLIDKMVVSGFLSSQKPAVEGLF